MAVEIGDRVTRLETIYGEFVASVGAALLRMERGTEALQKEMSEFKDEMKDFKDEMKDFKDEMKDFKDEMKDFKDEMKDFKDEMKGFKDEMGGFKDEMGGFKDEMKDFKDEMGDFKDEMLSYKDEARLENRRMNQKWGEVTHRLGTMVEDLVYPSLERIILEQFGLETDNLMVRIKRKLKTGERREFDAIALAGELAFLNSTKSTLKKQHVDEFVKEIPAFRTYFPEYRERKLIGILAALYIDESVLKYAEKKGFLVLGVGDEIMEVKNNEGFKPKKW